MTYWLAKLLFPKTRPDDRVRRLNLMVLVVLFSLLAGGGLVAMMLSRNAQMGK
jgi:hypothetical protein